jgi:hypothetical protein
VKMARSLMRQNPNLKEYVQGGGTFFFVADVVYDDDFPDETTEHMIGHDDCDWKVNQFPGVKDFLKYVNKVDDLFIISGYFMRFTKDSEVITNW